MPRDAFGNVADMIVDAAPTFGRMIMSRPFLHYIAAGSREIRRRIRQLAGWHGPMSKEQISMLPVQTLEAIWEQILLLSRCLAGPQYETYMGLNAEDRLTIMHTSLNQEVYMFMHPDHILHRRERVSAKGLGAAETCRLVRKLIAPPSSPVTYMDSNGRYVTTVNNVRIAPLYTMLLEKTPEEYSAMATGTLQHLGLLAPSSNSERYRTPWRNRSVRVDCEVGVRIGLGYMGAAAVIEKQDRHNNPRSTEEMTRNILRAEDPALIDRIIDRNRMSVGGHRAHQLWKHMLMCMGIRPVYHTPRMTYRSIHEQPNNHLELSDVESNRS